jgi:hypothetical protein
MSSDTKMCSPFMLQTEVNGKPISEIIPDSYTTKVFEYTPDPTDHLYILTENGVDELITFIMSVTQNGKDIRVSPNGNDPFYIEKSEDEIAFRKFANKRGLYWLHINTN